MAVSDNNTSISDNMEQFNMYFFTFMVIFTIFLFTFLLFSYLCTKQQHDKMEILHQQPQDHLQLRGVYWTTRSHDKNHRWAIPPAI